MSVPTSEIPQRTQDALRGRVDAGVWQRLPEDVRDRCLRAMHAMAGVQQHVEEFVELFNPTHAGPSRFADLPHDEQLAFVEVALLRPGLGDVSLLREVIDLLGPSPWSPAVRAAVIDLVAWPARVPASLSPADRARLRGWRAGQHGMRLTSLVAVLRHEEFSRRSAEEQSRIVVVLDRSAPVDSRHMPRLLDPASQRWAAGTVAPGTRPLFSESLLEGITLLEALHRVATCTLHPRVTLRPLDSEAPLAQAPLQHIEAHDARRRRVLGALVGEVARPSESFNQSNRNTCFATTLLMRLARTRPAEYARLAHELLTTGRSQLQNQDPVAAPDDALAFDGSSRSASERLTQATVTDYWSAGALRVPDRGPHYHNTVSSGSGNACTGNPSGTSSDGFDPGFDHWERRALATAEALLGQRFELVHGDLVGRARAWFAAHPDTPLFTTIDWGHGPRGRDGRRERYAHELDLLAVDPPSVPHGVVTYWNPWGALPFELADGNPLRVESGSVEPAGPVYPRHQGVPSRQTLDDTEALQCMTVQEFATFATALLMPRR